MKFYYHWFYNKEAVECSDDEEVNGWECAITPKEYFDKEKCLDDRGCYTDVTAIFPNKLYETSESIFEPSPESFNIAKLKRQMMGVANFIKLKEFSDFVEDAFSDNINFNPNE